MRRRIPPLVRVTAVALLVAGVSAACSSSGGDRGAGGATGAAGSGGGGGGGKTYTIIFAGTQALPNPIAVSEQNFADALKKSVGNQVRVQVHTGGDLGASSALLTGVHQGTIQMGFSTPQNLAQYYPQIGALGLPFVYSSLGQATAGLNSAAIKPISDAFEKASGMHILAWEQFGLTQVLTKSKAVKSLSDFKGMKIRTIADKVSTGIFSDVGANPVPADSSELYPGLQNGTLDGSLDPIAVTYAEKTWEVAKHIAIANVTDNSAAVLINAKFYDSLPSNIQQAVTQAAKSSAQTQIKALEAQEQDFLAKMKASGVSVTTLSSNELEQWKNKVAPLDKNFDASVVSAVRDSATSG